MHGCIRDERVVDSLVGLESAVGIPAQTAGDEVDESFVVGFERLLQRLATRPASAAFARDCDARFADRVEEELLPRATLNQMTVRRAKDLHDACELFLLVLAREDGIAGPELGQNAAEGPHVDAEAVAAAQDDLGAAVEAGLDVGVHFLFFAAG